MNSTWSGILTGGLSSLANSGGRGGANIPDAPSFQYDPNVGWSQDTLKGQSNYLLNGLTTEGGDLGGLMHDTVSFNPQVTQLALQQMQAQLAPSYRQSQQNLTNTLEANNQLTGSTTASAFGNLENDYLAQLTATQAQAGLADINRALQNRVSLYGTGLNTTQAVGNAALNNQAQMNNFALSNYDNQVAQVLGNQAPQTGGFGGAVSGSIGGGIQGYMSSGGNPYMAAAGAGLGGVSGYSGSPQAGGGILSSVLGNMGQRNGGNIIYNSGSAPHTETIANSLYDTPSWYGQGLGTSRTYGL